MFRNTLLTPAARMLVVLSLCACAAREGNAQQAIDWKAVDQAIGRSGTMQPGDVQRYNFPRTDLQVNVTSNGTAIRIKPSFALGGWIAMHPIGDNKVMAMGDLVLREEEIAPVMSRLQQGGVEQSALHHHLLHETPRVLYMHVHAMGDPILIAQTVRAAIALTGTPAAAPTPTPAAAPGAATDAITIDTSAIARTLGYSGRINGGVYQVSVPRAGEIRDGGMTIPPSMGLATAINFQPTTNGRAIITGDFVMIASEVNPVIRALRANGIEVTSLHNHLLDDEPRLYFMHFFGDADAVKLAAGLKAALAVMAVKR